VALNPPIPAPPFVKGIVDAWLFNKNSPSSYAMGKIRRGGFWYFYWLDLGVKTPIAFLLIAVPVIAYAFISVRTRRDWQVISPAAAHPDYIAYFNEIAGSRPEHFFVFGCDLDCGQDVERLSQAVRSRGISHLNLRVWTSADLARMNLPPFDTLQPYQHSNGWIAISLLHLQSGDEIRNLGNRDGYSW